MHKEVKTSAELDAAVAAENRTFGVLFTADRTRRFVAKYVDLFIYLVQLLAENVNRLDIFIYQPLGAGIRLDRIVYQTPQRLILLGNLSVEFRRVDTQLGNIYQTFRVLANRRGC